METQLIETKEEVMAEPTPTKKANEIKPGDLMAVYRIVDRVTLLNDDTVEVMYADGTSGSFLATDDVN